MNNLMRKGGRGVCPNRPKKTKRYLWMIPYTTNQSRAKYDKYENFIFKYIFLNKTVTFSSGDYADIPLFDFRTFIF